MNRNICQDSESRQLTTRPRVWLRPILTLPLERSAVIPELHIPLQITSGHLSSILLEDILQRSLLVKEDIQMIADNMSVLARRTTNQNRSLVISMLGHTMRRAIPARLAGETNLVCGFLLAAQTVLFFVLSVGLRTCLAVCERFLARRRRARVRIVSNCSEQKARESLGEPLRICRRCESVGGECGLGEWPR